MRFVPDISIVKSAQAAGRGTNVKTNSSDLVAPGESVVREFLRSGELRNEVAVFVRQTYADLQPGDLREYLSLICENLLPVLGELETALSRGDLASGAAQSHRLRNMTAAVGATRLSESLSLLERELRGAETPKGPFAMEEIRAEGEDLLAILQAL